MLDLKPRPTVKRWQDSNEGRYIAAAIRDVCEKFLATDPVPGLMGGRHGETDRLAKLLLTAFTEDTEG